MAKEDQLFVGAIRLIDNSRMKIYELSDEGGTIITITSATTTDSGTYTCKIADNRLEQSLVFTLQVVTRLEVEAVSRAGGTWLASIPAAKSVIITIIIFHHIL